MPDVVVYASPGEPVALRALAVEATVLLFFYLFDWSGT